MRIRYPVSFLFATLLLQAAPTLAADDITQLPTSAEMVRPLSAGESVPRNALLRTVEGDSIRLGDALRGKPSVLIFYRGGW